LTHFGFEGKGLTREFIVIHLRPHARDAFESLETIGKKGVRNLTWKSSVIELFFSIEVIDPVWLRRERAFHNH
jgi:hypothetical protein